MTRNLGTGDRILRTFVGIAMVVFAVVLPLPLGLRVGVLGAMGIYLALTSVVGSCLGYRLLGKSTCPLEPGR
jgi:hypothetical protein